VRRHPGSGRNALYIGSHASHIVGMPIEEGQELLAELIEFATQPQFVYRHKWQVGDLVIWDNRCTMHRATPFAAADYVRDMRRTTIMDKTPGGACRLGKRLWEYSFLEATPHFVRAGWTSGAELNRRLPELLQLGGRRLALG
jgi:hypothetical protein